MVGLAARAAAASVLAACGASAPPAAPQAQPAAPSTAAAPATQPAPAERPPPSQDEILAAIQKGMNDLKDQVQVCWAAAATERFDIEGDVTVRIDVAPDHKAEATVERNTSNNARLGTCVAAMVTAYGWAPPLAGQAFELPFRFRAPDGQNTIDRALVDWHGQGKVGVAVLLDENNTGSDAASLFDLAIKAGGTTGLRAADRDELWYFLGGGEVRTLAANQRRVGPTAAVQAVVAGDLMYVPRGGAREIAASSGDLHAMVAMAPGGREGAARAGALPTRELREGEVAVKPTFVAAAAAAGDAPVRLGDAFDALVVTLPAGGKVAEHVHAEQTELLYLLAGTGTLTVAGTALPLKPTSVVQVPKGVSHSLAVASEIKMVLVHAPASPERKPKR